jgi:hypothetical protein
MRESTRTTFANALFNLDTNKAVVGWKEDIFSSLDLAPDKELVFTESELTAEISRLEAEWDAQEYARNREAEYPSIADLVVALYDTDDKSVVEAKRAAVKLKYPKPE